MVDDVDLIPPVGTRLSCIILPLPSNLTFLTGEAVPFPVDDERIAWALKQAIAREDAYLLAVPRREVPPGDPGMPYQETGTLVTYQLMELPSGEEKVMLEGAGRARLLKLADAQNSLECEAEIVPDTLANVGQAESFVLKTGEVRVVPVLPLRGEFIAPQWGARLYAGRPRSLAAIERALTGAMPLLVPTQKDEDVDQPGPNDIPVIATLARIPTSHKNRDNTLKFEVRGEEWAKIRRFTDQTDFLEAEVVVLDRMIGDAWMQAYIGAIPAAQLYVQSYHKVQPFPFPREIAQQAFAQGFVIAGESPWHLTHLGEDCGYVYTAFARDTAYGEPHTIWQLEASHLSRSPRVWDAFMTILRETPSVAFWSGLAKISACVAKPQTIEELPDWVSEHCGRPEVMTSAKEWAERVFTDQTQAGQSL
jgi:hypothetical protein